MPIKIRILLLLTISLKFLNAQYSGLGSWNILSLSYQSTPKLSVFAESQLRSLGFYHQFHYYEAKGGLQYKVAPGLSLALGAGTYQTYREGGNFVLPKNNDEFRVWPQIVLNQSISKFKIEQRYRSEMRFTSNGYRNRFRYRLSVSYPFGKVVEGQKQFVVTASNELFFTNNEPYFERNRIAANLQYRPSAAYAMMLGYLHQFDYKINDETGRDFLQVGLYIYLKKEPK